MRSDWESSTWRPPEGLSELQKRAEGVVVPKLVEVCRTVGLRAWRKPGHEVRLLLYRGASWWGSLSVGRDGNIYAALTREAEATGLRGAMANAGLRITE